MNEDTIPLNCRQQGIFAFYWNRLRCLVLIDNTPYFKLKFSSFRFRKMQILSSETKKDTWFVRGSHICQPTSSSHDVTVVSLDTMGWEQNRKNFTWTTRGDRFYHSSKKALSVPNEVQGKTATFKLITMHLTYKNRCLKLEINFNREKISIVAHLEFTEFFSSCITTPQKDGVLFAFKKRDLEGKLRVIKPLLSRVCEFA